MKNRLLLMIAVCFVSIAAFAQWTAPEVPTEASTFQAGHQYRVRNADGEKGYIAGGYAWYNWGTSTILMFDISVESPITYIIAMDYDENGNELGYTFVNSATSLYTFISGESINDAAIGETEPYVGFGEMHMDGAVSNYSKHYDITLVSGTTYQISVASTDTVYASVKTGTCWGYMPNADEYIGAVWPFLDPSNPENACTWEFVDMTIYEARVDLYNALVESTNYADMDQSVVSAATTVYNDANATADELDEATVLVKQARNDAITKGATSANPVDATVLIDNSSFDDGIGSWFSTFVSGQNATNVGWNNWNPQSNLAYTYVNHEGEEVNPFVNCYIEAWEPSVAYGDASVSASIGDAELSQTIKEMPAGNWKLSADVIAVQQYTTVSEQHGVQLFATSGDYDMSIDISTGDGVPEHIELLFASSGDDLTLGLRTQSTNCNWIAADNFELICYGNDQSAYKFILEETINTCEGKYPDLNEVKADEAVKAAYEQALSDSKAVLASSNDDDELLASSDALNDAADALESSIAEYEKVADYIEYILTVEAQADENGWNELVDDLSGYREGTLEPGYEDGTLTSEIIGEMEDVVATMVGDYLSQEGVLEGGEDVSILIRNHDFDTDFSGWTVDENGATPTFGGNGIGFGGTENTVEGAPKLADINSGDAEVYQLVFDISQTIKGMPMGLYTLSCSGFARDDGGDGIQAELYAVLPDGSEQSQALVSLYTEGTEEALYMSGSFDDVVAVLDNGESAYVPNGMAGANVHFYIGQYANNFNILVTSRGDLTIGVRETGTNDWVIFDNFRLLYVGNDISSYIDFLNELIEEAEAIVKGSVSNAVYTQIQDAIYDGLDAIDDNNANECIEAIQTLQDAIAAATSSQALITEIEELYTYTNEVRVPEAGNVNFDSLNAVLAEVQNGLTGDGFENDEQIEQLMEDLNTVFTADVLADAVSKGASEESPIDVSSVIVNTKYTDEDGETTGYGWSAIGGATITYAENCPEISYGNGPSVGCGTEQVLYNLSAGYYILGVQAFYRPGNRDVRIINISDVNNIDTIHNVILYAGGESSSSSGVAGRRAANSKNAHTSTTINSIYANIEEFSDATGQTTGSTYTGPHGQDQAYNAFYNLDLYHNYLQFEVAEDDTDVPIGLKKTAVITDEWFVWSNWTLQYIGTEDPASDPTTGDATTAVEGVEGSGNVVATAVYSVDGVQLSHLTKGINIVKTTLSDGTVKVTKVLVK